MNLPGTEPPNVQKTYSTPSAIRPLNSLTSKLTVTWLGCLRVIGGGTLGGVVSTATSLPALVGFGIRSAEDAQRIGPIADGVVIGARLIELLSDAPTPEVATSRLAEFTRGVRQALDSLAPGSETSS